MKVILPALVLTLAQIAFALEVATLDNTGFQTDIFNAADEVSVVALSDTQPTVVVSGPDLEITDKMYEAGKNIYQYEFTPRKKGTYSVIVKTRGDERKIALDVK